MAIIRDDERRSQGLGPDVIDDGDRRMRRTTARVESRGEGASEDDERGSDEYCG